MEIASHRQFYQCQECGEFRDPDIQPDRRKPLGVRVSLARAQLIMCEPCFVKLRELCDRSKARV